MAINFLGQAKAPDLSGLSDIFENIAKGYKIGRMPDTMREEQEGRMRDNAIREMKLALGKSGEARAAEKFKQDQEDRDYLNNLMPGGQQSGAQQQPGEQMQIPTKEFGESLGMFSPEGMADAQQQAQQQQMQQQQQMPSGPDMSVFERDPRARALFKHRYGYDPVDKELSFMGPAREAMDLERLKSQVGEDSGVYQNALKSYKSKQQAQGDLSETRQAKLGGLGTGESWIKDDTGEIVGKNTKVTPEDKKEYKGRGYFNEVYPIMNKGLSNYSGQGSVSKFTKDVNNYGVNPESTKAVDDYLLAKNLVASAAIKEAATLAGGKTQGIFNRISKTLDSSDLPKSVDALAKQFGLPSSATEKANTRFNQVVNRATRAGELNVPAFNKQYFDPSKHGQSPRDRMDESIGEDMYLDNKEMNSMSDEELMRIAAGGR